MVRRQLLRLRNLRRLPPLWRKFYELRPQLKQGVALQRERVQSQPVIEPFLSEHEIVDDLDALWHLRLECDRHFTMIQMHRDAVFRIRITMNLDALEPSHIPRALLEDVCGQHPGIILAEPHAFRDEPRPVERQGANNRNAYGIIDKSNRGALMTFHDLHSPCPLLLCGLRTLPLSAARVNLTGARVS